MDIDKEIKELEARIMADSTNPTLLYELGRLYWKKGDKAKAITHYGHSAEFDPQGPGAIALEQARSIMNFYNPDLLNP